jgi:serine/threonine protein kinase
MSPEQVHGGEFEPASDLFSLGATLYAAVEGRSPFGKGCPVATLTAVVDDPPAPLLRAGPLGPVIEGLLAKDPARRLGPDQARGALRAIRRGELPGRIQVRPRARRPRSQGAGGTRPFGRIRPASRLVGTTARYWTVTASTGYR